MCIIDSPASFFSSGLFASMVDSITDLVSEITSLMHKNITEPGICRGNEDSRGNEN